MEAANSDADEQPIFPPPREDRGFEPEYARDPLPQDPLGPQPPLMETPPRLHEWGRTDLLDPDMTMLDNATIEAAAEAALEEEEIERNVARDAKDLPGSQTSASAVAAIVVSVPLCLCVAFSVSGLGLQSKDRALSSRRPGSPTEGGYAADASGEEVADDRDG